MASSANRQPTAKGVRGALRAAGQFAQRFIASIVGVDKALRSEGEVTPLPAWAKVAEYALAAEANLSSELLLAEREVEQAVKRKEDKEDELSAIGRIRGVLFEKGKPLERSIIDALRTLGFAAAPFVSGESEFDVVFQYAEGRLIDEAEGKDNTPINIEKLRQLAMNIHEDLQQATVSEPAKAVLFGNPYRLEPVESRGSRLRTNVYPPQLPHRRRSFLRLIRFRQSNI